VLSRDAAKLTMKSTDEWSSGALMIEAEEDSSGREANASANFLAAIFSTVRTLYPRECSAQMCLVMFRGRHPVAMVNERGIGCMTNEV
jgi:hypothetical protein